MAHEDLAPTATAENGFTVQVNGFAVELPSRPGGQWSIKEIFEWAEQAPGWSAPSCGLPGCGDRCFAPPEGTLISVPEGADFSVMSPVEVQRLNA
ncbi:hypothetical protein AB0I77_39285 [Streptomyces sp. NPDC050619]|uniref:hypothetical protein n=1 Tax=Streptomyces sp. NPDC050619 TaxID=3157214 RepID=UPI00342EF3E2